MAGPATASRSILHLVAQGITQRRAHPNRARTGELKVVVDVVPMRLRTHEDVMPNKQTNASADVGSKMVAAAVIGAAEEITGEDRAIKADAQCADAALKLGLRAFADGRRPHRVDIIENWPIRLKELIDVLMRTPGNFGAHAKVLPKQKIAAKLGIAAAAQTRSRMGPVGDLGCRSIRRGISEHCTVTECNIELLSTGWDS